MLFNKNDNGTAEVALYATWTSDHTYQHISKALELSKRKVLNIIDKETYEVAKAHYLSDDYEKPSPTPTEALLDELVHKLQAILVNFAYCKNINKDTVIWDNSGIKVQWDNDFRPAQQPTLDNLADSLEKDGYEFLDLLIAFLNENKETFTEFHESIESRQLRSLFINNAAEFSYYFNINNSDSYFFDILDVIRRSQRGLIRRELGQTLYDQCINYQLKRLQIEAADSSEIYADTYEGLDDIIPSTGQVVEVRDEKIYYQWDGSKWREYAHNISEILALVKPILVDLTMHMKFYSDINNLRNRDPKQLEILRGNAETLRQAYENGLKELGEYIAGLNGTEEEEPETDVPDCYSTNNSFMM